MERIGHIINMIDHILDTKKKRHLAGGILMSVSLLFGGLAITVLTVKSEDEEGDNDERYIS